MCRLRDLLEFHHLGIGRPGNDLGRIEVLHQNRHSTFLTSDGGSAAGKWRPRLEFVLAPRLGLEPRTYRLTAGRSTIELSGITFSSAAVYHRRFGSRYQEWCSPPANRLTLLVPVDRRPGNGSWLGPATRLVRFP